ncbi:hypothetical protein Tco_0977001 [Tanacetum coccineum]|uniref:Uncharacterized protein n=1 Tax=Tanacetum coccineum TaxID=301880 RepID=A0ABQ5EIW2_9ASTR
MSACCGQVLWIQNQLLDYGYNFMNTVINIDNNSTICIIENPVQHSKTKHIEIRHHFIRDCNAKKLIQMVKIHTDHNVADLLTKGFDAGRHVKRGRDTKIPQSSGPPVKVGDEAVHKELGDRMERAATTASSLEAEQDSGSGPRCQDTILGGVDAQTRFGEQKEKRDMATAKAKTVNGERQLQAIADKKKKKQSRRKQQKTPAVPHPSDSTTDVPNEKSVPTHSNDPLLSGEDRLKLTELMDMCTKLSERVLELEHTKTAQAKEITNLKLRVKKLENKAGLRTHKFKRLYKEDASNQWRSIEDIDKDTEVSLVDEIPGRSDDAEIFDTDVLFGNEVFAKNDMIKKDQDVIPKEVSTATPSTTAVLPPSPVITESTATTTPSTIPKAKGITFRDAGESTTRTPTSVSSLSIKDKGKAKMDEPEVPLKKKDQIALNEEMNRNLEA